MRNVVVYNKKGGVGKTLICDELCYKLERENIPFNFISLDPQGGARHSKTRTPGAHFTIVDMPGHAYDDANVVLKEADYMILPFDMSGTSIDSTVESINQVLLVNPHVRVVLVMNMVKPRTIAFNLFHEQITQNDFLYHASKSLWEKSGYGDYPGFEFFNTQDIFIKDSVAYQNAIINRRSVYEERGGWRKTKPFDDLLDVLSKE